MPIDGSPHMFIPSYISRVPEFPGVYALSDGADIMYYGSAEDSIKDRLIDHYNGNESPCTQDAISGFSTKHPHRPRNAKPNSTPNISKNSATPPPATTNSHRHKKTTVSLPPSFQLSFVRNQVQCIAVLLQ